jgi:ferredoxin
MPKIRIANRNGDDGSPAELEASPVVSILNSLLRAGVRIRHDCGGRALCGTCAVRVVSGGAGLSPVQPLEAGRLAAGGRPDGFRLACQARAAREATIEIASQADDGSV